MYHLNSSTSNKFIIDDINIDFWARVFHAPSSSSSAAKSFIRMPALVKLIETISSGMFVDSQLVDDAVGSQEYHSFAEIDSADMTDYQKSVEKLYVHFENELLKSAIKELLKSQGRLVAR